MLCVATIFTMTVEYDEAWIAASTIRLINGDLYPEVVTVFTTGGLYTLVVGAASALGLPPIIVARLLAFASLAGVFVIIHRLAKNWFDLNEERRLVLLMAIAAPGTLTLGAMGYGIVPAMLAFLCAVLAWESYPDKTLKRIALTGLFLGLAMATRLTFVPVLPVFLIWSAANLQSPKANVAAGGASAVLALLILIVCLAIQFELSNKGALPFDQAVANNLSSTGAGAGMPTAARFLSFIVKGTLFVPISLVLLVIAIAWGRRFEADPAPAPYETFVQILTLAGLAVAGFWVLKSPFQHVRYIWPAVFLFYLGGGIYLAELVGRLLRDGAKQQAVLACAIVAVGLFGQSFVSNVRLTVIGAGMQTNAAGQELLENHFKAFRLIREQDKVVAYLKANTEADARMVALGLPAEWGRLQLALLSEREIVELEKWTGADDAPQYFVAHRFSNLNDPGRVWLNENAALLARIDGYEIYRAAADAAPPDFDTTIDYQLYRFTLPRAQSLTGAPEMD